MVVLAAGVLSALFVNDVICVVLAPVVLAVVRQLRLPPVPYLLALATAANVGSVATLTGNPQNMLIGSFSGISYRAFLTRETPVALVGLACVVGVLWLVYRRQLPAELPPVNLAPNFPIHAALMTKTIVAVCVMLVAFFAGVPIALVAVGGAAVCLLTRRVKPEKVYREIDWHLLVLFTGLFVVIGGVEAARLTDYLFALAGRLALVPARRAHHRDCGVVEPGVERSRRAALQDRRAGLRGARARGSSWRWRRRSRGT